MFYIKRTYGGVADWLHAWDKQYGTSCKATLGDAMPFLTHSTATAACDRANAECKDMPAGMAFSIYAAEPKQTERVSLYHTRTGLIAFEVFREMNSRGVFSYRYRGKHGAGCGNLISVVDSIQIDLAMKPSIKLVAGVDLMLIKVSELRSKALAG